MSGAASLSAAHWARCASNYPGSVWCASFGRSENAMRRCRKIVLVGAVVAVSFLYPLLAPTAHRIDRAHFDLIKDGLTRTDVEAIFGVPPGEYDWAEQDGSAMQ